MKKKEFLHWISKIPYQLLPHQIQLTEVLPHPKYLHQPQLHQ